MSESRTKDEAPPENADEKKSRFLGRLFEKLDESLKRKAGEQADRKCGGSGGKGGKCC